MNRSGVVCFGWERNIPAISLYRESISKDNHDDICCQMEVARLSLFALEGTENIKIYNMVDTRRGPSTARASHEVSQRGRK
jgi:hypothetical protein